MHPPNTLAAAVLACCAGLTVFSLTSCADSNVATGQTLADANSPTHAKTRAEAKAELNQAIMSGWHIDKGD